MASNPFSNIKMIPTLQQAALSAVGYVVGARLGGAIAGVDGAIVGSGLGAGAGFGIPGLAVGGAAGGLVAAFNRFQAGTLTGGSTAQNQSIPNVNAPPTRLNP